MTVRTVTTAELAEGLAHARAEYAEAVTRAARLFFIINSLQRELAARGA